MRCSPMYGFQVGNHGMLYLGLVRHNQETFLRFDLVELDMREGFVQFPMGKIREFANLLLKVAESDELL